MVNTTPKIIIRKFKAEDAEEIYQIIKECFLSLDLGKHTKEGIRLQLKHNSPENLIERAKKINYFVAEIDGKLIGICGYDETKLHTFFISLHHQKRGIGHKLLLKVLQEAKNKGITKLITWSTLYAYPFYSKYGFKNLKEIKLPEGKEEITLIEMEKRLE